MEVTEGAWDGTPLLELLTVTSFKDLLTSTKW